MDVSEVPNSQYINECYAAIPDRSNIKIQINLINDIGVKSSIFLTKKMEKESLKKFEVFFFLLAASLICLRVKAWTTVFFDIQTNDRCIIGHIRAINENGRMRKTEK